MCCDSRVSELGASLYDQEQLQQAVSPWKPGLQAARARAAAPLSLIHDINLADRNMQRWQNTDLHSPWFRFSYSQPEHGRFHSGSGPQPCSLDGYSWSCLLCVHKCISLHCFVPTELPEITAMQSQDHACLVCCRRCLLGLHVASSYPCLFHRCLPSTTVSGPWMSPTLLNMLVSYQVLIKN